MVDTEKYKIKMKQKLDMIWEAKRLETFKVWPYADDKTCSASKMAEAGFYFTGNAKYPDVVQCFFCAKSLDGWEESDDPWLEHLNHASHCSFAQLRQPEAALTFDQWMDFKVEMLGNEFKKAAQEARDDLDAEIAPRLKKATKAFSALKKKNGKH